MTDEIVNSISERYIELYEQITGEPFQKTETKNLSERIENNIIHYLQNLKM